MISVKKKYNTSINVVVITVPNAGGGIITDLFRIHLETIQRVPQQNCSIGTIRAGTCYLSKIIFIIMVSIKSGASKDESKYIIQPRINICLFHGHSLPELHNAIFA